MQITTYVPENLLSTLLSGRWAATRGDPQALRRAVQEMTQAALASGCVPVPCPPPDDSVEKIRVTFYLPLSPESAVNAFATDWGCSRAEIVRRLLAALAASGEYLPPAPSESHPVIRLCRALGQEPRREQAQFYDDIMDALRDGAIGLVEAGTGIGKTRAELLAAAHHARATGAKVCLAVPTLALMRQALTEYEGHLTWDPSLPPIRPIRGRCEFFSDAAVLDVLAYPPQPFADRPALEAWLSQPHSWLADDLAIVAPDFPIDEVRLDPFVSHEDRGYLAYAKQFGDPKTRRTETPVEIVLCTHAMLAQDSRQKMIKTGNDAAFRQIQAEMGQAMGAVRDADDDAKPGARAELKRIKEERAKTMSDLAAKDGFVGLLPAYVALIVDEAHLLESTFSSALGDYVSLRKTIHNLRTLREAGVHGISTTFLRKADALLKTLSEHSSDQTFEALDPGGRGDSLSACVRDLCAHLASLRCVPKRATPKSGKNKDIHQRRWDEHRRALAVMRCAIHPAKGSSGTAGYLVRSPTRSYPSIYLGPRSVETVLSMLWNSVKSGAVVSATLYTESAAGGYSSSYQRSLLGIGLSRAREYPPLHVAWTRTPVTVHTHAAGSGSSWLRRPPDADDPEANQAWLRDVATCLESIYASAAGGVLVLLTSYDIAAGLAEQLTPGLGHALIAARTGYSLHRQQEACYRSMDAGHRPLWLALGGAWTGIDVGGHSDQYRELHSQTTLPAADDNLFTDLVIPALPYGVNQSLTFRWRVHARPAFPWRTLDAAFFYRQGLGRLIRRPGIPENRHIWVLDARLGDPTATTERALFLNPLLAYPMLSPLVPPAPSDR